MKKENKVYKGWWKMKLIEIARKNHVSEIVLIIFFLFLSFICLNFIGDIPFKEEFTDYSRISDLIQLLKIDVVTENVNMSLIYAYKRYIILFLGSGYLTYLILLTILFHKTCKESILYIGSLYFSFAIGTEILSYVLPFDNTKVFLTILSWIFVFCGYIRFIKYFWELLFNKQSKIINIINLILILATVFPLSLAIKEFHIIYFTEDFMSPTLGLQIFFDYFKNGFIVIIMIFSFISIFYNKNKNKKKESLYYFILFSIQLLCSIYIYNELNLYGNFEFMAHFMLNILFVHVQLEDIKLTTDNQFFRTINFNVTRILITFITISYFIKKNILTGYVTGMLAIIISVEIISFVFLFFSEQEEVNFDNFLNKLKGIESLNEFYIFLEDGYMKMFRLIEFKMIVFDLDFDSSEYEDEPLITFSPIFEGKKYDIRIKIQNRNKLLGFIYIKDPRMLLYRRKLKNLKKLTLEVAPVIENLLLKNLQIHHYKKIEKELNRKIEVLEKDLFYIKELAGLIEKVDDKKKIEILGIIRAKLAGNSGGEK